MAKVNLMNMHVSNIEMSNVLLDTTVAFIENLLDNLDDVSKYAFMVELATRLDDLTQTCYDSASESSQTIIDYLENTNWDYEALESYREYTRMMKRYLYSFKGDIIDDNLHTDDTEDVTDAFNLKDVYSPELTTNPCEPIKSTLQGQLHFPNDYANEEALTKGVIKSAPVNDPAEERKQARAAYLAAMKQQNTSQPT